MVGMDRVFWIEAYMLADKESQYIIGNHESDEQCGSICQDYPANGGVLSQE
jgi:hypothetical protein